MLMKAPIPMTFVSASHVYLPWANAHLALCLNSVLNVKALVGLLRDSEASWGPSFQALVQLRRARTKIAKCISSLLLVTSPVPAQSRALSAAFLNGL